MTSSYEIFPKWQLKYVHISDAIELNELLELAKIYFEDPKFDPSVRFFVDLRNLTSSTARFRDVAWLYSYYRRRRGRFDGPIDVAIVAPSDFAFGLAHMFFALADKDKVMRLRIFAQTFDAIAWLKLPTHAARSFRPSERK